MENKKSRKGLIVLVVILSVLLVGVVGYVCYDKLYLDKSQKEEITNLKNKQKENNANYEKQIKDLEEQLKENETKPKEDKISEAIALHKTLTDGYNSSGLYFGKKQTIETVPADDILPYVVFDYVKDKKVNFDWSGKDVDTFYYENDMLQYDKFRLTLSKKEFDKYFKEKFNTNRTLNIEGSKYYNKGKYIGIYTVCPKNYEICLSFTYDINSKKFYFGNHATEVPQYYLTNKFIKYEIDDNNMYIYDKVVEEIKKFEGNEYTTVRKSLITVNYLENKKITSDVIKNLKVKEKDLNAEYIFENYDEYLDTYKHTFKKADNGKYYWYSSEIVK